MASGEGLHRPDLSVGDGIYKSTDAGKTWTHLGLRDAQQIPALAVDPRNPNRVFAAALGHPYGPNEERGIFRSTDGGQTWQKVLYKNENTGGSALELDPSHPDVIMGRCGKRGWARVQLLSQLLQRQIRLAADLPSDPLLYCRRDSAHRTMPPYRSIYLSGPRPAGRNLFRPAQAFVRSPAWRERIRTIGDGGFLQAYDEGEGTREELAEQFRVQSPPTAYRLFCWFIVTVTML